jgi:hypothetical protein
VYKIYARDSYLPSFVVIAHSVRMTHLLQLGLVQSVRFGLGVLDEYLVKLGLDEPAKSYIYSGDVLCRDGHLHSDKCT